MTLLNAAIRMLVPLAIGLGLTSCSGGAGFAGGSGKAQSRQADAATPTPTPTVTAAVPTTPQAPAPGIPASCGAAGVTQANLQTAQVSNANDSSGLDYTLSLTDCQGNAQTISAASLLFDFDGRSLGKAALDFSVTDGAQLNYTGKLIIIHNTDLFGRTGTDFQHYQSDNPFRLVTAAKSIGVHVAIGETGTIAPIDPNNTATTFSMATYLRLGEATPVEKDVQVTP